MLTLCLLQQAEARPLTQLRLPPPPGTCTATVVPASLPSQGPLPSAHPPIQLVHMPNLQCDSRQDAKMGNPMHCCAMHDVRSCPKHLMQPTALPQAQPKACHGYLCSSQHAASLHHNHAGNLQSAMPVQCGGHFQTPPSVPRAISGGSFPHVPLPLIPAAPHSQASRVHLAYKQGESSTAREGGGRHEAAAGSGRRRQPARPAARHRRPPRSSQASALLQHCRAPAMPCPALHTQARLARELHVTGRKLKKSALGGGGCSERPKSALLGRRAKSKMDNAIAARRPVIAACHSKGALLTAHPPPCTGEPSHQTPPRPPSSTPPTPPANPRRPWGPKPRGLARQRPR